MEKKKIALIHNIISPYRQPLFESLSNENSVDLYVYYCAKSHKNRKWNSSINNNYKNEVLGGITLPFSNELYYHINPSIIYKLLKEKFDIIIIGGSTDFTMQVAFLISKLTKTPIILWSEGFEGTKSFLGKFISPITNFLIKRADAVIVPGTKAFDYHIKLGAHPNKIFIAPNTVDNKFFIKNYKLCKKKKEILKKEMGLEGKKIILFVGQLVERKGVKYLLKAYKILKDNFNDLSLIIVGSGPIRNNLTEICKNEDIEDVEFTGWLSEDKLLYFSIADVFVLPSLQDLCPLVLNEAMCCELPIVTTNMVGCAIDMVIPGENGFIVKIKDPNQLYISIKKILTNDHTNMGKMSLNIIKNNFLIEHSVEGFMKAIMYSISP